MPNKIRGHRCVLCRRNKNDCGSLMLHRFPKDVARCKKWVEALNLPSLARVPPHQLNHSYVLCSDHFRDDQYLNGRLLYNSIPVRKLTRVKQGDFSEETSDSDERALFVPKKEPSVVRIIDNNFPFVSTDWNFHDFPRGCYDKQAHGSDEVRVGPSFSHGTGTMGRSSPAFIGPDVPGTHLHCKIEPGPACLIPYDNDGISLDFIDVYPTTVDNEARNVTDNTIKSVGYDFSLKLVKKDGTVIRVREERPSSVLNNPRVNSFFRKDLKKTMTFKRSNNSQKMNIFALSTYSKNPKVYNYLKEMFGLPDVKTVKQWKKSISFDDEFWNSYIFSFFQRKASVMKVEDKLCGIVLHVFPVQNSPAENTNLSHEEDLSQSSKNEQNSNINENSENNSVGHVLVLVLKSLKKSWHYVLGCHQLGNSIKASFVKQILEEYVIKLQNIKIYVKFVLSMYDPVSYSLKELFGVTPDKPYITVRKKRLYFLCDPQVLILDTLKAFSKNDIYTGNGLAKWDYVYKFLEKDSQKDISIGPKLESVLETITLEKSLDSCVKVASQVFSQAVALGIYICTTSDVLPEEAVHTAEFVLILGKLINCFLLSKTLSKPYEKKYVDHMRFLESLKSGIFTCRFVSKTNEQSIDSSNAEKHCFLTWQTNVNALLQMWKELFNIYKISQINVQTLCQTCVDDLHKLRYTDKDQPMLTHLQFEKVMKKIFFKSLRQTSYLEDYESFFRQNP
ncbi:uncharacterized protein [Palaemon carinicauda]|uniref:uncharacterized protein n=1 Tax=Palaemon carinicauda TaxID=392227 RepID=UPI0035B5B39A